MKAARTILATLMIILTSITSSASGLAAVYGVVDKVVFEPNEQAPQRIQIWGAFAFVETGAGPNAALGTAYTKRGYLYFELASNVEQKQRAIRSEWADFKSMAGTGQGVAFGRHGYIGTLPNLVADNPRGNNYLLLGDGMRVRNADEPPSRPDAYLTNIGIVKLAAEGSHAAVINQLKQLLRK